MPERSPARSAVNRNLTGLPTVLKANSAIGWPAAKATAFDSPEPCESYLDAQVYEPASPVGPLTYFG